MEEETMAMAMAYVDPEAEFLALSKHNVCSTNNSNCSSSGNEWELSKENVKPLKRGRKVQLLNHSLKSHKTALSRNHLFDKRRKFIEAIDEYQGEDPLLPWIQCIKWVQESFPAGGEYSGLLVIYEQCVRTFWHESRYKEDQRYLKVWLEYAENCVDAEVIYKFLSANDIGQTHANYYISYAAHMESKNKLKAADEILNLGIVRKAEPVDKLKSFYKKFLGRCMQVQKNREEELDGDQLPARSFGTILDARKSQSQATERPDVPSTRKQSSRLGSSSLSIFNDLTGETPSEPSFSAALPIKDANSKRSWEALGSRVERNKENAAIATKWTSNKVQRRAVHQTAQATSAASLQVYVDDEYGSSNPISSNNPKVTSNLPLRRGDSHILKKDSELLKENPLRHFPSNSLPR